MEMQLHNVIAVSGSTRKILLTFQDENITSSRVLEKNKYVATIETFFEIAGRAGYLVVLKGDLIKKLSE
ncbi:MAG: hypothetical protein AB8W37_13160 [Arsenophonus endosymbiont of Dermacentor nuttalli]